MSYSFSGSWEQQLDHYLTTPPEDKPMLNCDKCGDGIYCGERYYYLDWEYLCRDCALDWLEDNSRTAGEGEEGEEGD